jgi:hypothetical protein
MSKNAPADVSKPQPKISQKMLLRFAVGLIVLALLFVGYRWWRDYSQDPDLPAEAETAGMIAALEMTSEGTQAVIFEPDGNIRKSPGYLESKTDKELVWRPDGNRLFFTSDREEDAFHIYRWNLASDKVMRRSFGSRSQSSPTFAPPIVPDANEKLLITAGGFVLEFDPRKSVTHQVLPPVGRERSEGEEGAASQFDAIYQRLGTSFRKAIWGKDKKWVAAVMRREDQGEILIVQNMESEQPPMVIMAGDEIEFCAIPTTGAFAFVVNGFQFHDPNQIPKENIKDGKVVLPFQALLGIFDPDQRKMSVVMPSAEAEYGFRHLGASPDGANLLLTAGKLDPNGNYEPVSLLLIPAVEQGGASAKRIMAGAVFEPSWGPDSHAIVFIQRDSAGKRGIFTINKDGSGLTDISKGRGDFAWPSFSPKKKS